MPVKKQSLRWLSKYSFYLGLMQFFYARYRALILLIFLACTASQAIAGDARFFSLQGTRNSPQAAKLGFKPSFFSLSSYRQPGSVSTTIIASSEGNEDTEEKTFEMASLSLPKSTAAVQAPAKEAGPALPKFVLMPSGQEADVAGVAWPLPSSTEERISSGYGQRLHPITGRHSFHDGVDIVAAPGTSVLATVDGTVEEAGRKARLGNYVRLRHEGGLSSIYGHLASIQVKKGQNVAKGQIIGRLGSTGLSTGPHLHYAMKKDGESIDPMPYLTPKDHLKTVEVAQKAD